MPKKSSAKRSSSAEERNNDHPPKIRKSVQSKLLGAVTSTAREFFYVGKEVLLTDEIYNGTVPDDMREMLFCYAVTGYNIDSKEFTLRYNNKMIGQEEVQWLHQDGGQEEMPNVSLSTVKSDYLRCTAACTRINDFKTAQVVDVAKKILKQKASD